MSKFVKVDLSHLPNQPTLTDDQELDEALGDPRLKRILLKFFTNIEKRLTALENKANNTTNNPRTEAEIKTLVQQLMKP